MDKPNDYRYAKVKYVEAADKLLELKKTKPVWTVIDAVLLFWTRLQEKEYRSFLIQHKDIVDTRKKTTVGGSEFSGVTKDKATGGTTAYMLDIPERVIKIIRVIYTPDELPMDKKFYNKFGKRYSQFKVMQKKG